MSDKILYLITGFPSRERTNFTGLLCKKKGIAQINLDRVISDNPGISTHETFLALKDQMDRSLVTKRSLACELTISDLGHLEYMRYIHEAGFKIITSYFFIEAVKEYIEWVVSQANQSKSPVANYLPAFNSIFYFKKIAEYSDRYEIYCDCGEMDYKLIVISVPSQNYTVVQDSKKLEQIQNLINRDWESINCSIKRIIQVSIR